ncbi:MAG: LytTR family transcriptional regulator DNA-binding domain-containing protein [Bacteroidales bacterium]|jgi:DNA-binding LytR/AlgR family response regulator|nr:LytTR family transcriptional regulator DNA-binding domain-containing protein [Bacteroidales bacterium]
MDAQQLKEQALCIITVEEEYETTVVNAADILYIECKEYLTTVHLIDGQKVKSSFLLKRYEELLHDKAFKRVNYHTLVNGRHIKRTIFSKERRVVFIQATPIQVSRRRVAEVKKWIHA